ncbi:MAG: Gfo/Idh/MocA family oxidoreductase [Treponema sp.]|nr:Gfo/Idh/MocA family oxidoreductase [Treponema sp.]
MAKMSEGMNYAPKGKPKPVVKKGEFAFAAISLDHGHINGQSNGLIEAGADLKWVYDPDPKKSRAFAKQFPQVKIARTEEEVLSDPEVKLVAAAAIPSDRCALGLRVMAAGKDYFTDKTPLVSIAQLNQAKAMAKKTKKKYMCYFSERLHVESAIFAGYLIEQGAIGSVIQVLGTGPHRLGDPKSRPDWFYKKEQYGGILCDIGSHQVEQFLFYGGCKDAKVLHSKVANYNHPQYPELEDFGDATLVGDNGVTQYFRVDWFTPRGLQNWGDGRTIILGTEGFIEQRKYLNLGIKNSGGNHLYLANKKGETYFNLTGKVGFPFFGQLILDCINRTENAMTQEHCFKAAELCVRAQMQALRINPAKP